MAGKVYVFSTHIHCRHLCTYCVHENMDKYPSLYNTYIYTHAYIHYDLITSLGGTTLVPRFEGGVGGWGGGVPTVSRVWRCDR